MNCMKSWAFRTFAVLLALLALAMPALAAKKAPPKPAPQAAPELSPSLPKPWPVQRFVLDNGMRVVVHTDRSAPIVALGILVDVGSRDEVAGKSGLAHFFEHMMFQGSKHSGKMEHIGRLEAQGAEVNANTSADRTWYYEVVPRPALQLALWLEADRFEHLGIDQKNVDNQRQAVLAEMAERIDNQPLARASLEVEAKTFASWEMGHPTIGSAEDLQKAPLQDFVEFWKHWYSPSNCVVVLSGDIDVEQARPLLADTLAKVLRRGDPKHTERKEAEPAGHVALSVPDPLAKSAAVHVAWRVPAYPATDSCALDLLGQVLGGDESSRLEKRLVREKPLAVSYFAGTHGRRDADLFHVSAELANGSPAALVEVKKRIGEELLAIALHGVSDAELQRARLAFEAAWIEAATKPEVRAELLAQFETWLGDAGKVAELLPRYRAVTAADVQRVARQYLTWDRQVEIDAIPASWLPAKTAGKPEWVVKGEKALVAQRAKEEADAKRVVVSPVALPDAATAATLPQAASPSAPEAK
jgi:predicted Zn-dependent peptidase